MLLVKASTAWVYAVEAQGKIISITNNDGLPMAYNLLVEFIAVLSFIYPVQLSPF
jgi:hypothetical protein